MDRGGRFGRYGGRFVPETLIPALEDLEAAWNAARRDPWLPRRAAQAPPRLHRSTNPEMARFTLPLRICAS